MSGIDDRLHELAESRRPTETGPARFEQPRHNPANRTPWRKGSPVRTVTRAGTEGVTVTADYLPHELTLMVGLKDAGAGEEELAFLHELKAVFGGTFERDTPHGVVAVVDEQEHYRQRNTSLVRQGARWQPADETEIPAEPDNQGHQLPIEQGESGST
jgi:hypothetical protein